MATITTPQTDSDRHTVASRGPWATLGTIVLAVAILGDVAIMTIAGELIPPLLAFGVVGLVGIGLLRRDGRVGPILLLIAALVPLLVGVPFWSAGITHPESSIDFLHAVSTVLFRITAIVAAVALLRGAANGAVRAVGAAVAAVAAIAVVVSGATRLSTDSDVAQPGDVAVAAASAEWSTTELTVSSGGAVVVDNTDAFRHTFTVVGTDVDVELPASTARRVELDLPAGTYELICDVPGHTEMVATLEVT